jgi:hypothetical protein
MQRDMSSSEKSSKMERDRNLARIPASKAKAFLIELANLQDGTDRALRFMTRFSDLFQGEVPLDDVRHWAVNIQAEAYEAGHESPSNWSEADLLRTYWLPNLRDAVRVVWKQTDLVARQWGVLNILGTYFVTGGSRRVVGPILGPLDPFAYAPGTPGPCGSVLLLLVKYSDLIRYCADPGCPTPFFIARRRSQRFCSDGCARPAQQKAKRDWWARNGKKWRRSRRAKSRDRPQKNSTRVPRGRSRTEERAEKKGGKHGNRKTR